MGSGWNNVAYFLIGNGRQGYLSTAMGDNAELSTVFVRHQRDTKEPVRINLATATVSQLKEAIQSQLNVPVTEQRLIFSGKLLTKDLEQCTSYGMTNECTIHLVRNTPKLAPAQQLPPPSQPSAPSAQFPFGTMPFMNASTEAAMQNPQTMAAVFGAMRQNPQLFQALMQQNPMFQSLSPEMQRMFSDPGTLETLLNSGLLNASLPTTVDPNSMQTGAASQQPPGLWEALAAAQGASGSAPQTGPPVQAVTPEKLQQLREMGFFDNDLNTKALELNNGNVNRAVDWLLAHAP